MGGLESTGGIVVGICLGATLLREMHGICVETGDVFPFVTCMAKTDRLYTRMKWAAIMDPKGSTITKEMPLSAS